MQNLSTIVFVIILAIAATLILTFFFRYIEGSYSIKSEEIIKTEVGHEISIYVGGGSRRIEATRYTIKRTYQNGKIKIYYKII